MAKQHEQRPRKQSSPRPPNLADLVPDTVEFSDLETWIRATLAALGTTVPELSDWCGLTFPAIYGWLRDPNKPLATSSQCKLHDVLGVRLEELERLRPSAKRGRTPRDAAGEAAPRHHGNDLVGGQTGLPGLEEIDELTQRAHAALREHDPAKWHAYEHCVINGESQTEVARALGITQAGVFMRVKRAKELIELYKIGAWYPPGTTVQVAPAGTKRRFKPRQCEREGCLTWFEPTTSTQRRCRDCMRPVWLDEALQLYADGYAYERIAAHLGISPGWVRYWLQQVGVPTRDRTAVQAASRHAGQRTPIPSPPEDIRQRVPDTKDFSTLEDWLKATLHALDTTVVKLAAWCGISFTTMYTWLSRPEQVLYLQSQQRLQETLGVSIDELERLRPSAEKRSEFRHESTQVVLERYGEDHFSRMGLTSAQRTRGKLLDPKFVHKRAQRRWGVRGWQRKKRKEDFRRSQRGAVRPPGTGQRIIKGRTVGDRDRLWRAENLLAAAKRRRPVDRSKVRELREAGLSPKRIANRMGVGIKAVRRTLGEMGLMPMPKGWTTADELREARRMVESAARKQAREKGHKSQHRVAKAKVYMAIDELLGDGKTRDEITQTMVVKKTIEMNYPDPGVHRETVKKILKTWRESWGVLDKPK